MRLRSRDDHLDLPSLTPTPALADLPTARIDASCRYLGTTVADTDARVRAHGLGPRTMARIRLSDAGLDIVRVAESFRIPATALRSARRAGDFAGKAVRHPGALVVRWEHGQQLLDTGFRLHPPKGATGDEKEMTEIQHTWSRSIEKIARRSA